MQATTRLTRVLMAAALYLCLASPAVGVEIKDLTPRQILDHVDDLFRGKSSEGMMTMTVVTKHWKRSLTMQWWSKGKERTLIRILAPKKEEGTATLRVGNDVWNYLPKVKRVIKLPSSMMSGSWMGSHFTNDDLVKESRMADDYDFKITFQGVRDGKQVIEITCLPKPKAAVVWGKVLVVVRAEDYMPIYSRYFNEDMKPARTMYFTEIGLLGGRKLPKAMKMVPDDKPGEYTMVTYHKMRFDLDLADSVFSLRSLRE